MKICIKEGTGKEKSAGVLLSLLSNDAIGKEDEDGVVEERGREQEEWGQSIQRKVKNPPHFFLLLHIGTIVQPKRERINLRQFERWLKRGVSFLHGLGLLFEYRSVSPSKNACAWEIGRMTLGRIYFF